MIISSGNTSLYLLNKFLKEEFLSKKFLLGSQLPNDSQESKHYNF